MNAIISNTGPLIALGGVDRLYILNQLYQDVIVPVPVHEEILEGGSSFIGLSAYIGCTWIQVCNH
jgi:predicted nucleic acid-binding protein